jgi:hypothetical protein
MAKELEAVKSAEVTNEQKAANVQGDVQKVGRVDITVKVYRSYYTIKDMDEVRERIVLETPHPFDRDLRPLNLTVAVEGLGGLIDYAAGKRLKQEDFFELSGYIILTEFENRDGNFQKYTETSPKIFVKDFRTNAKNDYFRCYIRNVAAAEVFKELARKHLLATPQEPTAGSRRRYPKKRR